jgi:single-strand DNA-binding protein
MASVNKAILIGHLGRDPEIRYTPSGTMVANISIATTDKWKDKTSGQTKESTEWHRVTLFERLAEIAQEYLISGSQVYIEGRITTRQYTDKNGVKKYITSINANDLVMLGRNTKNPAPQNANPTAAPGVEDDDIPF